MTDGAASQRLTSAVAAALLADDSRIVITGAGGWLGMATIELLHNALGAALPDRLRCFGASARTIALRGGVRIEQRPLGEIADLDRRPTIVLHLAFLTKDRALDMEEADYVAANRSLSQTLLDALDAIGAQAVFVASSGAADRADAPDAAPAMRLYGSLKRADERAFAQWAENSGQTAIITRVFNVTGPYINKHEHYALAAFILDALAGRTIQVRAPFQVIRGYVAIRELMSLVFALLLVRQGQVLAFDSGGEAMELATVAAQVAQALGGGTVARAPVVQDRIDRYVGEGTTYRHLLAQHRIDSIGFAEQVRDTAEFVVATARVTG